MRIDRILAAAALAVAAPAFARAQPGDTLSPEQAALACAPPPAIVVDGPHALRIIGAQDARAKSIFDEKDLLVLDGGTGKSVQLGQQYFVRRPVASAGYSGRAGPHAIHTAGWIRIVAVNDRTAIAAVERLCDALEAGDYLEPFAAPPALPRSTGRQGEADFGALGRVIFASDERTVAGPREFMLIDRGSDNGVTPGTGFLIFRDVHAYLRADRMAGATRLPLASIGEAVVVTAGPSVAVVQVLRVSDAVQAGDFVAPRK